MTHYYVFPVGDWSGDGHAFVANFLVSGNLPLQDVRETHFKENEFIGSICEDYNDKSIDLESFQENIERITNKSVSKQDTLDFLTNLIEKFDLDVEDGEVFLDSESLVYIWIFVLNSLNPELGLTVLSEATPDSKKNFTLLGKGKSKKISKKDTEGHINFYGYDEQGRHLSTPGYGVWDGDDDTSFYLNCN